jgi:hypothetical protein
VKDRTTDKRIRKDKRGEDRTGHDREHRTLISKTGQAWVYGHGQGSAAKVSYVRYLTV